MKQKIEVEVGDIVSLTSNRLIKIGNTTKIDVQKSEGEVVYIRKNEVEILINGVKSKCDIKNLEVILKHTDREFNSMTLTRGSIMGYGNIHKGKKLKDIPAYYFKHLIDYQYVIPDNLTIYIADNWNSILDEIANDNVFKLKNNEIKNEN